MLNEKKKYNMCWIALITVMAFIHCFRIGSIPYGINVDEMGMGYDAWCLANFGTDRYLKTFPVYLINFGGGQSALYAYLCAPFVYIFGISAVTLRIPAIIFAFMTLFFSVKIADCIWNDKRMNLLVGLIYTMSPVFLMLSRIELDCNLMLGMATMYIYFLIKTINRGGGIKLRWFILTGIIGGLVLYSYVISHLVMPLFILFLTIYLFYIKRISIKQLFAMTVPMAVLAMPLILFHIINIFNLDEISIGIFTIPRMFRYRGDDLSIHVIGKNLLHFFKTTLLCDNIKFNSIEKFGNMYYISVPFIIIGLIDCMAQSFVSVKNRHWNACFIISIWFICVYITGAFISTADGANVYQLNSVFATYLVFCADGLRILYKWIKKHFYVKKVIITMIIVLYSVLFICFSKYYFFDYTEDTYLIDLFNFKFDDVLSYIDENMPASVKERNTYVLGVNQTYIFYLGSTMTSPYEYNELVQDNSYTLWLWTQIYKNYRFYFPEEFDPPKEFDPSGNYIVPETSENYINQLEEHGLEKLHIGNYYLFWNQILCSDESNAQAIMSWDHGALNGKLVPDDGDNSVLSGWAINLTNASPWDDIIAWANGKYYVAKKMERTDVTEVLNNESLLMSGFHITIPSSDFIEGKVRVYFIDYDNKSCYIENY